MPVEWAVAMMKAPPPAPGALSSASVHASGVGCRHDESARSRRRARLPRRVPSEEALLQARKHVLGVRISCDLARNYCMHVLTSSRMMVRVQAASHRTKLNYARFSEAR